MDFGASEAYNNRAAALPLADQKVDPKMHKYNQAGSFVFSQPCIVFESSTVTPAKTKEALQKFMDSIMTKSGKLRSLIRELKKEHSKDASTRSSYSLHYECH